MSKPRRLVYTSTKANMYSLRGQLRYRGFAASVRRSLEHGYVFSIAGNGVRKNNIPLGDVARFLDEWDARFTSKGEVT